MSDITKVITYMVGAAVATTLATNKDFWTGIKSSLTGFNGTLKTITRQK